MKKKLAAVAVCVLACVIFGACSPALKEYDPIISEIRSNLYVGSAGSIKVDAITGKREEPFEIDGKTGAKQNFTVITIYPSEYNPKAKYTFDAVLDGVTYSGEMVKHPFNNTYSAEVEAFTAGMEIEFTLKQGGNSNTTTLVSIISEGFIEAEKALEIALKKLSSGIRSFKNSNTSYEIYIRLLENPVSSSGGYHWYVAFVGENEVTYAVLIDPITLEIVAIRE